MKKAVFFTLFYLPLSTFLSVAAEPVFGPGPEDPANKLDSIAAIVNDDVITRSELNQAVADIERQIQARGTPLPPRDVLENQVLERLILNQLELRATESNNIVVDDQTVNAAMEDIARRNNITLTQLREILERDGVSFAKFREDIRKELLTTRLRQRVVDSQIQVSAQEVDNWLASMGAKIANQEYHLGHILIALPEGATPEQIDAARGKAQQVLEELRGGADFKRMAVAVSDGRQALEGGDLGWRKAEQIPSLFADAITRLEAGQISDPIRSPAGFHIIKLLEVRGSQRQLVTQTQARQILIIPNESVSDDEAKASLQRLRERILNGEDFGALARANSDDTTSAAKGGELGWVNPASLAPEFERQMNDLQPGEVSEPFKTQSGWHIVQVLARRQQEGVTEAERAAARENLLRRKAEEEWDLWLRRLRDEAYVEIRL